MRYVETCPCCNQPLVDAFGFRHRHGREKSPPRQERNSYAEAMESIMTERRIKAAVKWLEKRP